MTSSKSNSWLARAIVLLAVLVMGSSIAEAERKRLVVLEFEGDDAEKLRKSFVKFLKKEHTVVKTDRWAETADELGASKVTEKNVKKVARKLKIDGLITANVEKRRDEYLIRIKLRSGASGSLVGSQVNIKTDGTKLNKSAKSDLRDELLGQIDSLASVRRGGGDDDEDEPEEEKKPSKFSSGQMDDDEKPSKKEQERLKKEEEARKKAEDEKRRKEEERAALAAKREKEREKAREDEDEDEDEAEENPLPKPKKDKKKVARRDDDEDEDEDEGIEEEVEVGSRMDWRTRKSVGQRAIDAVAGVSFSMRRLAFTYDSTIGQRPAGYKGKPVPGGMFDATVYPLAFGADQSMLRNIGITMMYDQVLLVKSEAPNGTKLNSAQSKFAAGIAFRYPFGKRATSPVIGARVRYGRQAFKIQAPANGLPPVPNVNYTILDPGLFFRMPLSGGKMVLNANAAFLAITNTGQMQNTMQGYGAATVSGFEASAGLDYQLTRLIFLRGNLGFQTIGFTFTDANAMRRDNEKVKGARDSYFGAAVTAGYLF